MRVQSARMKFQLKQRIVKGNEALDKKQLTHNLAKQQNTSSSHLTT